MAARFGDMLLEQRRRMGLSIQQVANTIKIRPQIIEYFETGNFASMPPRGYAQGMISSYARFLGLNPREVVLRKRAISPRRAPARRFVLSEIAFAVRPCRMTVRFPPLAG